MYVVNKMNFFDPGFVRNTEKKGFFLKGWRYCYFIDTVLTKCVYFYIKSLYRKMIVIQFAYNLNRTNLI